VLDVQYRMHPAISTFPSKEFYQGRLKDGEVGELSQADVRKVHIQIVCMLLVHAQHADPATAEPAPAATDSILTDPDPAPLRQRLIRHPCIHHPGFVAFCGLWLPCCWRACLGREALWTPFMVHHVFACAVQGVQAQTTRPWHSKQCFGPFALFDLHGKEDVPEGSASIVNR
jgi:hypothetical protein